MRMMVTGLTWAFLAALVQGQPAPIKTGPEVGAVIPHFTAVDQNGVTRTSESILGPKGALLVFFRSADW